MKNLISNYIFINKKLLDPNIRLRVTLLLSIIITILLFILIGLIYYITKPSTSPISSKLIDQKNEDFRKSYYFKNIIAWIPDFDYENGKVYFYRNIDKYTEISPVYYTLQENGILKANQFNCDVELVNIAHKNKVKVTPSIASFSEVGVEVMLNNTDKYQQHLNMILSEIERCNYDGIDIDYESINLTDKEPYLQMVKDLSDKLHKKNKILSITVIAKDKDSGFSSFRETREVQDWKRISEYADQIRIMAYDYSGNQPGPISPISWVENIMKYAQQKIPDTNKIIIGQPFYGYAYGNKRYAYTYDTIAEVMIDQDIAPEFDRLSNEKILRFTKNGEDRKLWFHDFETYLKRFYLIEKYSLGGIAFWRLGGEDEQIYSILHKSK